MKNSKEKLENAAKTMALTSLLTLPLVPNDLYAQGAVMKQSSFTIAINGKQASSVTIVSTDNGNPVFRNERGEFFTVNSQTGDLVYMPALKMKDGSTPIPPRPPIKTTGVAIKTTDAAIKTAGKEGTEVTILGVDKDGQTILRNNRGETFYVHPTTGDFIYLY
jgi:hypothetical protein